MPDDAPNVMTEPQPDAAAGDQATNNHKSPATDDAYYGVGENPVKVASPRLERRALDPDYIGGGETARVGNSHDSQAGPGSESRGNDSAEAVGKGDVGEPRRSRGRSR